MQVPIHLRGIATPRDQLWLWPPPRPMRALLGAQRLRTVPAQPGVYLMTGRAAPHTEPRVLYVGKSVNLRRRLASYRGVGSDRASRRLVRLGCAVDNITWETCADDRAARLRENFLLRLHRPRFNSAGTHPESHWFAALRVSNDAFELARLRELEGAGEFFGPFNHGGAFSVLVRALWVALHPPETALDLPARLFGPKPRASLRFEWESAHGDAETFQNLLRALRSYLDGSSLDLAAWLRERLEPAMTHSAFARTWLTADLEMLEHFFARVTRRNAELRRRFGIAGTLLRKAQLDDLTALAGATAAACAGQ